MATTRLRIWCGQRFRDTAAELLETGTAPHELLFAAKDRSSRLPGSPDTALAEADVAFGQPDPASAISTPRLRWIHLTSAGYTRFDRQEILEPLRAQGTLLTNSSHVFNEPCAQHVLAMMLALARRLPQAWQNQQTSREWLSGPVRRGSYLINGQSVLILGYGAIARRLVELLRPFDMKLAAFRRRICGDEGCQMVEPATLNDAFAQADHVVNLLPANAATAGFVSAERIGRMKPQSIIYNIGRGTTVDQAALLEALHAGRLAAAYLDVTDPEPLPPDHRLWTAPNCYITPHTAGGHAGEQERVVKHFLQNLKRFESGQELIDRVI